MTYAPRILTSREEAALIYRRVRAQLSWVRAMMTGLVLCVVALAWLVLDIQRDVNNYHGTYRWERRKE